MRLAFLSLLAAATFSLTATTAEAKRVGGFSGWTEQFHFVADTGIDLGEGPLSLCHMTRKDTVLFIGVWRSSKGYALVSNGCNAGQYRPITAEQIAQGQAKGLIPLDVRATPVMTTQQKVSGFFGLGLLGAILGLVAFKGLMGARRRKARHAKMGNMPKPVMAIIDAMCHAARVDGHVADEEILEIAEAAEAMTGQEIDPADVLKIAELASEKPSVGDFATMVKGLNAKTLDTMMRGVLHVVIADGELNGQEKGFVSGLAKAMKMPGDHVQYLMAEIANADRAMA